VSNHSTFRIDPGAEPVVRTPTVLLAFIAIVSSVALAAALVSQHRFGMEPCAWCVLQRLIFIVLAVVALVGLAWRSPLGARVSTFLTMLLADLGIAAAAWQHFVAARSDSCKLTFADRVIEATGLGRLLPDVFEARANCAEAAVDLLGVPYAYWSGGLFIVIAIAAGLAFARSLAPR